MREPSRPSFSLAQVNAHLWSRQGFARTVRRPAVAAAERVIGVYAAALTCCLSLLARDPAFQFRDLDEALHHRRQLVRIRAMRGSSFLIPTPLGAQNDFRAPLRRVAGGTDPTPSVPPPAGRRSGSSRPGRA